MRVKTINSRRPFLVEVDIMNNTVKTILLLLWVLLLSSKNASSQGILERAEVPYLAGESKTIITANPDPTNDSRKWYSNDHCFVYDKDSTLHWFGINNPFPKNERQLYQLHPYIGHLVSTNPPVLWDRLAHAMDSTIGSENLGAPYVIWHEESARWAMVVGLGFNDDRRIEVCWSDDLYNWKRTHKPILEGHLSPFTRDPHIIKGEDGKYWITLASPEQKGDGIYSEVIRIKTEDFQKFEKPEVLFSINDGIIWSAIESPLLVKRKDLWYLFFTYAHRHYSETIVLVSERSDKFRRENTVTTLYGHAPEIFIYENKTYISSCGPEDRNILNEHGVTIAELKWLSPSINN